MYADLLVQITLPGFSKTSPAVFDRGGFLSAFREVIDFWLAYHEPAS